MMIKEVAKLSFIKKNEKKDLLNWVFELAAPQNRWIHKN